MNPPGEILISFYRLESELLGGKCSPDPDDNQVTNRTVTRKLPRSSASCQYFLAVPWERTQDGTTPKNNELLRCADNFYAAQLTTRNKACQWILCFLPRYSAINIALTMGRGQWQSRLLARAVTVQRHGSLPGYTMPVCHSHDKG